MGDFELRIAIGARRLAFGDLLDSKLDDAGDEHLGNRDSGILGRFARLYFLDDFATGR